MASRIVLTCLLSMLVLGITGEIIGPNQEWLQAIIMGLLILTAVILIVSTLFLIWTLPPW